MNKLPLKYQGVTEGAGPWEIGEPGQIIESITGSVVAECGGPAYWRDANATLIADSKRLAGAVVELRERLQHFASIYADENSHCHAGLVPMAECSRCGPILAAREALTQTAEWAA